jgi:type II secretory pathway pseudopilin PulG
VVSRHAAGERGYALVALIVAMTVMLILMLTALPAWRYVMKNERELELIFRQEEIARAVKRYQAKHNQALPVSLDVLIQTKMLRRKYKNPLSPDGRWHYVRQNEAVLPGTNTPTPKPTPSPAFAWSTSGPAAQETAPGPFIGVRATSTDKALRVVNGREAYNEWLITSVNGLPVQIGKSPLTLGRPNVPVFPAPPPTAK